MYFFYMSLHADCGSVTHWGVFPKLICVCGHFYILFIYAHFIEVKLGPVVQSILSLMSSLRGQLVKCLTTL